MQIPILSGIFSDVSGDFRTALPRNMIPVPKKQGISAGYLRPGDGIVEFATGPGVDRGGINWNGVMYRAMGNSLVTVSKNGIINILGVIGGTGSRVKFDYSFDRLALCADGKLFYWNGTTLTQVTDPDLGVVIDFAWVDGYFMTTDGTNLVVTELNNPLDVNPLKYGSAEADPDPIKGIVKIRNEIYAVGRYTIEVFDNVGGNLFPFQRIQGAEVMRGAISASAMCPFIFGTFFSVAMIGSARNEPLSIWLASNGSSNQIATREIDTILRGYTEEQLSNAVLESRVEKAHAFLYIHLPDQTLVYDASASAETQEMVWFVLTSSIVGNAKYRARNFVWCYDKWISGDPTTSKLGYFVNNISSHYDSVNGWEFGTTIVYNSAKGAIFHELELISLTGNVALGVNPTIWTSYSLDGITWSQEKPKYAGKQGRRDMRINWLLQGNMQTRRMQKFRGTSDAHISIAALEARLEPLN